MCWLILLMWNNSEILQLQFKQFSMICVTQFHEKDVKEISWMNGDDMCYPKLLSINWYYVLISCPRVAYSDSLSMSWLCLVFCMKAQHCFNNFSCLSFCSQYKFCCFLVQWEWSVCLAYVPINSFHITLFLYSLKAVFWCFQGYKRPLAWNGLRSIHDFESLLPLRTKETNWCAGTRFFILDVLILIRKILRQYHFL